MNKIPEESSIVDLGNCFNNLSEPVLRWAIALSMVANDLVLLLKLIKSYGDLAESHYFFRLSLSHLREAAKVIESSRGNKEIQAFLQDMDTGTQGIYRNIVDSLVPFENGSVTRDILKSTRDECFHYPDIKGKKKEFKDLPQIMKALNKKEVRLVNLENNILGARYLFADAVAGLGVNNRLSNTIVDEISKVSVQIIQFVDHLIAFLKNKPEENNN